MNPYAILTSCAAGKESLIQELTERLTKLQTPGASSSNQTFNAHFITREAADSEKRGLEDEIARLKDLVKQRDASLAGKEQQIQALRNESEWLEPALFSSTHS